MTTQGIDIRISGLVQGVGFRPFVYQVATRHELAGKVWNDSAGVGIEAFGSPARLDEFVRELQSSPPPLAKIDSFEVAEHGCVSSSEASCLTPTFRIGQSAETAGTTFVAPDTAPCEACLAELSDPDNRRFRHPFITCTNCGPRFSITKKLPYDRPSTTMASFLMCGPCDEEYRDPTNRRYHSQPTSCNDCGPRLTLRDRSGPLMAGRRPITEAAQAIADGLVIAIKGVGGFQLCVDATNDHAVEMLRRRKQRPDKPLAVMVPSLEAAGSLARLTPVEAEVLTSSARPIVLARSFQRLAHRVTNDHPLVGIMLPSSPVHYLLLAELAAEHGITAIVATSGNRSGTPISYRSNTVEAEIGFLYDAVLDHDRPIHTPSDDSVIRVVNNVASMVRRARGFAPLPLPMPEQGRPLGARSTDGAAVLAVGGELKNTLCITKGSQAWLSQHIGDMGSLETLEAFEAINSQFRECYGHEPTVVVADAHPRYQTRGWAQKQSEAMLVVQHHHAHAASLLTEHGLPAESDAMVFCFDGTGYGSDGTIWGGEVLDTTSLPYERVAHLRALPLPGGDQAVVNPYRIALAYLHTFGIDWDQALAPVAAASSVEIRVLRRQLERSVSCTTTSSMGRLFDAVSSLVGLRHRITFEAQGAIELESAAVRALEEAPTLLEDHEPYCFGFDGTSPIIDPEPVIRSVVADLSAGLDVGIIAAKFHNSVADVVGAVSEVRNGSVVGLTGGVFQNALLTELTAARLSASGPTVFTHARVPANDGGLALGQAALALAELARSDNSIRRQKEVS